MLLVATIGDVHVLHEHSKSDPNWFCNSHTAAAHSTQEYS